MHACMCILTDNVGHDLSLHSMPTNHLGHITLGNNLTECKLTFDENLHVRLTCTTVLHSSVK